ncbi:hypothetical protein [Halomonas sp. E19]|uniref:hypothetical protein n=1 Tax=Halomonas sp. E19 TaxID=3397247 RepID=UPI004033BDA3
MHGICISKKSKNGIDEKQRSKKYFNASTPLDNIDRKKQAAIRIRNNIFKLALLFTGSDRTQPPKKRKKY